MSSPERDAPESDIALEPLPNLRRGGYHVVWREGEPFDAADLLSDALQRVGFGQSHPVLGEGIAFELDGGGDAASRLEFYPDMGVARVRVADSPGDYQTHEYKVERIAVERPEHGRPFVSFTARRKCGGSAVNVFPSGEISEIHFPRNPGTSQDQLNLSHEVATGHPDGKRLYSVPEAAAIIGCHPSNVRQLLQRGRLPGGRLGKVWWVEADAVDRYRRTRPGPGT
jgi:excisionase family DNA binding protein